MVTKNFIVNFSLPNVHDLKDGKRIKRKEKKKQHKNSQLMWGRGVIVY